jgi:DNA-binding response OmpR family regulator
MHSITLLKLQDGTLSGRAIMSQVGRLFQRDLTPSDDPVDLLRQEPAEIIVAAFYSPAHELESFLQKLKKPNADTPVYLVASDLSPETVIKAVRSGAQDVFLLPFAPEDLLKRLTRDSGASDTDEPVFSPDEWRNCCSFLQLDPESTGGNDPTFDSESFEAALIKLEADRQELERERQALAGERERLKAVAAQTENPEGLPDDLKLELKRQAEELEEQRFEFEEQKIFLMDAQREVEAARSAWEKERLALEESNQELQKRLDELEQGSSKGKDGTDKTTWLRNRIGSLPLAKRNNSHNLSPSEINELVERAATATEARRGLEAEFDEISRAAAQARARQVELEQEVADLRSRYENTGGGGLISGGSLVERLERLSESIAAAKTDLDTVRSKRAATALQIETLSAELSNQEVTEALTPTHLNRLREVKTQRKELQESERIFDAEEALLQDNLDRDQQEILMIESWVDELESAREKITAIKSSETTATETDPEEEVFQESPDPVAEEKPVARVSPKPKKGKAHGRKKSGLSRRFALRGII